MRAAYSHLAPIYNLARFDVSFGDGKERKAAKHEGYQKRKKAATEGGENERGKERKRRTPLCTSAIERDTREGLTMRERATERETGPV